jgi:predicted CoA-substrate-specific enzyme activase
MITAGVDCGAKTVKVVIMKDRNIVGKSIVPAGLDAKEAAAIAFDEALKSAGMAKSDVEKALATGAGRKEAEFAKGEVTEVSADAKGINYVMPGVRTVIDVGAEEGRTVKLDGNGRIMDFAVNEKCAAGAGTFVEAMARALETSVEKMGDLYFESTKPVPMNAQCAVFAESELVSLVHSQASKPDIARAVLDAIADRIVSMVRRVGLEKDVAAVGGVSKNRGFIEALKRDLEIEVLVPAEAEYISAIGAAIIAAE